MKSKIQVMLLILIVSLFSLQSHDAQSQSASSGLDIIIAIDSSGSMQNSYGNNEFANQDNGERGLRLFSDERLLPNAITDPNNLSYDTANFVNQWLADFITTQQTRYAGIDVTSTVLHFNSEPTILGDRAMNLAIEPTLISAPNLDGNLNADFINLYTELEQILSEADDNRRQAVFIITDSLPCNPDAPDFVAGEYVRGGDCNDANRMADHIDLATDILPRNVEQYIYFVGESTLWVNTATTEVRDNWENGANLSEGAFHQINNINDVPSQLFEDVLDIFTRSIVGSLVDDSSVIGVFEYQGRIEVPPYQEFMDVILFLDDEQSAPRFASASQSNNISDAILADYNNGQIQRLRFNQPESGSWTITGYSGPIWVSYKPATPSITLEDAVTGEAITSAYQYQEVRAVYRLLADDIAIVDVNNPPEFSLTMRTESGESISLDISAGSEAFNSDPFVLTESGTYTFDFDVAPSWQPILIEPQAEATDEPNAQATGTTVATFNFLTPAQSLSALPVAAVEVEAILGTEAQQTELSQTNLIEIRRSQNTPFVLNLTIDDELIDIPNGLTANLILDGEGCLETPNLVANGSSFIIEGGALSFEQGRCTISYDVSFTSNQKPLEGESIILVETTELGTVSASVTRRLDIVLLDNAGDIIDQSELNPASVSDQETAENVQYEIDNVATQPVLTYDGDISNFQDWITWEQQGLSIDIVFTDNERENLTPTEPIFANYTAITIDDGVSEDFPIPFDFTVVRLGDTEAEVENSTLVKNPRDGYYTLELSGLEPGDYIVTFELLLDDSTYALDSAYEYSLDLLDSETVGNPRLYAFVRVNNNEAPQIQINSASIILASIVFIIFVAFIRWIIPRRAPLKGKLAIYQGRGDTATQIWQSVLPPNEKKTINTVGFDAANLINDDTLTLNPSELVITTKGRSKAVDEGKVWVKFNFGDNIRQYELESPTVQQIEPGSDCYLVYLDDKNITPVWDD